MSNLPKRVRELEAKLAELETRFFDAIPHVTIRCPSCEQRIVQKPAANMATAKPWHSWTCAECFAPATVARWIASGAAYEAERFPCKGMCSEHDPLVGAGPAVMGLVPRSGLLRMSEPIDVDGHQVRIWLT